MINISFWAVLPAIIVTFGGPVFALLAAGFAYLAFRRGASSGVVRRTAFWLFGVFALASVGTLAVLLYLVLNSSDGPIYARTHQMRWLAKAETIEGVRLPAKAFVQFAFGRLVEATVNDGVRLGPLETLASTLSVQNGKLLWGDEFAAGELGGLRVKASGRAFLTSSGCQFRELALATAAKSYLQLLADQPAGCAAVLNQLE